MRAYSQDLRERVLRALERGDRPAEIARRAGVPTAMENSPIIPPEKSRTSARYRFWKKLAGAMKMLPAIATVASSASRGRLSRGRCGLSERFHHGIQNLHHLPAGLLQQAANQRPSGQIHLPRLL